MTFMVVDANAIVLLFRVATLLVTVCTKPPLLQPVLVRFYQDSVVRFDRQPATTFALRGLHLPQHLIDQAM